MTSTDASIAQATPHHFSASALQSQSALEHKSQSDRLLQQSDGRLTIRAYAKINLGLRIFPARADGFHPLESWMVPISWYDTLFVSAGGPLNLRITGRTAGVPTEIDKNLVGKAAVKLAAAAGITPTGTIELHKVLPPGGGLGGGSADAANALVALNTLWKLDWPDERLQAIAAELGSDVAFFVQSISSLCTGRGEIMSPLRPGHPLFAVLILPNQGLGTKEVYQAFDAGHQHTAGSVPARTDWARYAAATADELNELLVNDLEPPAFAIAPWLAELHQHARRAAGQTIHMTGSGSTLFTLCSSAQAAEQLQERLRADLQGKCTCVPVRILRQR